MPKIGTETKRKQSNKKYYQTVRQFFLELSVTTDGFSRRENSTSKANNFVTD